jgi:hypothetical protein
MELQGENDSLRDDLTHGLFRTHKFSGFSTREISSDVHVAAAGRKVPSDDSSTAAASGSRTSSKKLGKTATARSSDVEEQLGAVAVAEMDSNRQQLSASSSPPPGHTVDLLTGQFVRQRANALDTAAPQERSDLRKMKKAAEGDAAPPSSRRQVRRRACVCARVRSE